MEVTANTFSNRGKWKVPVIEIQTKDKDSNLSFYYSSTNDDFFGMQIDNHEDADKIKQLCFVIDKKMRELHKLVNK